MCFSATASFVTAGVAGAIGVACLYRVREPRDRLLATIPLLFAAQQGIEGLLWLNLPLAPTGPTSTALTLLFLVIAEVVWPVYAPAAVLMADPSEPRRRLMWLCLATGVGVAIYLLWSIAIRSHSAAVIDGHIVYVTEYPYAMPTGLGYLAATGLPLVLSSRRAVAAFGWIVLAGTAVAYAFYWQAYVSIWCFFAAAASVTMLAHFETAHRRRTRVAGA
jgi:hypothetical protein